MRLVRSLAVMTTVVLAACASVPPLEDRKADLASARSIAVVVAIGRQVEVDYIGLTIFNNTEQKLDIQAWGVDKTIQQATLQIVPKRLAVQVVEYAPELERVSYLPMGSRGFRSDLGEQVLAPYIEGLSRRAPVDLILFILPTYHPAIHIDNRRMYLPIGFIRLGMTVVLMDAKSKKEVYGSRSLPQCNDGVQDFIYSSDMRKEIDKHRAELEERWMTCINKQLEAFRVASGIS